ncbi:hypothetical protein BKA62DRAFT_828485 [Auriculariales sp. MPI-PUGE-AT-0066]|nr:hypothetical protein BKA62DRAFT_828485 [Auriculariales sp. MPI-PUGE-AT-0066]
MKSSAVAFVLSLASAAFAGQVILSATDGAVVYSPAPGDNSWAAIKAPGALNGGAGAFLLGQNDKGKIVISPTQAFTSLEFWGWQRSDGGVYQITFDGAKAARIDVYNPKSDGNAVPMRLFKVDNLSKAKHVVEVTNLNDTRTPRGFGQMNFDHVILTTVDGDNNNAVNNTSSTSTSSSTSSTSTSTSSSTTTPTPTPTPTSTTSSPVVIQPSTDSPSPSDPALSPEQNTSGSASSLRGPVAAILAAAVLFAL